ncbi:MAG TPA: DNA polymerase III subunit gamma/tau [bacterium]|mgnify:CR=1 FL=1|nr:DNA polymerase III subunit gamma/tau [bacterium]
MGYISLYRKYRSQTFDDLVGQEHITTTLKNAIERNRLAHAYLFSGPRGTGKTSAARILAKSLNCEKGPSATPCNACDVCLAVAKDSLFDVIEIDAASNRGIDDIRDLREKVRIPPIQARFKVYIIDEVHMLTKEAFNALLKTLEEPPAHVMFVMATTEPQKLPATILSRCQRFEFRRLTDIEIMDHIRSIAKKENCGIDDGALRVVVKTADGSMRDAISILDQLVSFSEGSISLDDVSKVFGMPERQEIAGFINAIFEGDVSAAFDVFGKFFDAGKSFNLFIRLIMEHMRDIYLVKQRIKPLSDALSDEDLKTLGRHAKTVSRETIVELLTEISRVEDRIRWETYPRIVLEILLVKMANMIGGPKLLEDSPSASAPARAATKPAPEPAEESLEKEASSVSEKQPPPAPPRPAPHAEAKTSPPSRPSAQAKTELRSDVQPPPMPQTDDPALKSLQAAWPAVLKSVRETYMPVYFMLAKGAPHNIDGGVLSVRFGAENALSAEMLSEKKNIDIIEAAIKKAGGAAYSVKIEADDSAKPSASAKKEATAPQKAAAPRAQAPEAKPAESPAPADPDDFLTTQPAKSRELSLFDTFEEVFPEGREI